MTPTTILIIFIALVFLFIGSSMWVFLALGLVGVLGLLFFTGYPVGEITARVVFSMNDNFVLICLPLFILMGELIFYSGASTSLYSVVSTWVERLPGGLLHSNVLACTIFAAISGSSAVTEATIASVAVPELRKLGYDEGLSVGSLAGAGTLGILIPPSIMMIVYGALTSESIGQLYIAGILPGLMLSALFMAYIGIRAILNPRVSPSRRGYDWKTRLIGLTKIWPIIVLIGLVLGFIYAGIATPTEAAALGALGALGTTLYYRTISWSVLRKATFAAVRITSMIMLIISGAIVLSSCMAFLRIPQAMSEAIIGMGLSKWAIFVVLVIIYLILGCFFEGNGMMVLTLPLVYPLIINLGFDGIWFGIIVVILIEAAQVTPPVGFNLYVIQNISGAGMGLIIKNSLPFCILMMVGIVILSFFPQIALWLPYMMIK